METKSIDVISDIVSSQPPPEKSFKRPLSVSPTKKLEQLKNFPGGCCVKCKQELESLSSVTCVVHGFILFVEVYQMMYRTNGVLGSLNNLVYYCEANNCISQIKQLLFTYFEGKLDTSQSCSDDSYNELKSQICSITSQVKDLIANNNQLQKQISSISTSINNLQKTSYVAVTAQTSNSLSPNSSSGPSIPQPTNYP